MTLAVSSDSMSDVVMAKRNVGSLTDPNGHYRKLFIHDIDTVAAWEKVKKYRQAREALEKLIENQTGRKAQLSVHGNRFLEHVALSENRLTTAEIQKIHTRLDESIQSTYPESYLAVLFKNAKKCDVLANKMLTA